MTQPSIASTLPSSWSFRAEGGANLVLSYAGPDNSPFSGKVLRLRKRKRSARSPPRPPQESGDGDDGVRFSREVVAPLLGEEFVVGMESVDVEECWLRELKDLLLQGRVRPVEREAEDEVDERQRRAVLADDLLAGEGVLAIEIKVCSVDARI